MGCDEAHGHRITLAAHVEVVHGSKSAWGFDRFIEKAAETLKATNWDMSRVENVAKWMDGGGGYSEADNDEESDDEESGDEEGN